MMRPAFAGRTIRDSAVLNEPISRRVVLDYGCTRSDTGVPPVGSHARLLARLHVSVDGMDPSGKPGSLPWV